MSNLNRRAFLASSGLTVGQAVLFGQEPATAPSYSQQYPDMLLSHIAGKLNALAERWDREREKIRDAAALQERNRFVRAKFVEMLNGYPEKTPLRPKVLKVLKREGYRIENLMFESRPDFFVTGNLYVPEVGNGPFPAIISPCGHYPLARMQPDYQFVYLNLVKAGFVVLAYDPIGQGERRQYWNPETGRTESSLGPVYEHSMPGQLLLLLGENLSAYRIWDGIRAIDYLQTRPEVDKEKIGCAGHSGGGTLTLFISALDERVGCAVVNEGGTVHRWPLRVAPGPLGGPGDVEQNLFPSAIYGIDRCDLHVAIAPRPLMAQIEEFTPAFNLTADHIRQRYKLFGSPEKFATVEATDPHAYTLKLRQATTDWFCRWFYGRKGPASEPEFEPEPPPNLYCTPRGSLRYAHMGDTIFSRMRKTQAQFPPYAAPPSTRDGWEAWRRQLLSQVRDVLRYHPGASPLGVRHLVTTERKGYRVEKFEFLSEPEIYVPTWVFVPNKPVVDSRAILFVNDSGVAEEGAEGMELGVLPVLARKGHMVVAIEPRGTGLTTSRHARDGQESWEFRHLFSAETAAAYLAWYMDRSLLGMRVLDVVRGVDFALGRTDVDRKGVRAIGVGRGATWLLLAAALDGRVKQAVCDRGLLSWKSLVQTDRYLYGADMFAFDVLRRFDLPQVAAALADRPLALLSPLGPMKNSASAAETQETYAWTRQAYDGAQAGGRLLIETGHTDLSAAERYLRALAAARA